MKSFVECGMAMQNFLMILLEICLILFRKKENYNGNDCFFGFLFPYVSFNE